MVEGLTKAELLAASKRDGWPVSPDQLKRWRREGLLPRPVQRHLVGARGSESRYPAGTLTQLTTVARLHSRERRFKELRFDTWWAGYWVESQALRQSMIQVLEDPLADIRQAVQRHSSAEAAVNDLLETDDGSTSRSPIVRLLRTRVGGSHEDLVSAMHPVVVLALGGEPTWETPDVGLEEPEPSPRDLLMLAMGFIRATTDVLDSDRPMLEVLPEVVNDLTELRDAGALELIDPGQAIQEASDPALELARQNALLIADQLPKIAQALELRYGRDAAGLGLFTAMQRRDVRWFRAFFVRFSLIALRTDSLICGDDLDDLQRALSDALPAIDACLQLATRYPGYKPFLGPNGPELLDDLPEEERLAVQRNLTSYVDENPHLRALLERDSA